MAGFANTLYSVLQKRRNTNSRVYDITPADIALIEGTARRYGFPPEWLSNLIGFETAGTFSPAIQNPISGATGLIQFMPSTARDLGVTTAQLKQMSFRQQWQYVEAYLNGKMRSVASKGLYNTSTGRVTPKFTQTDLFMLIFYPVSAGNPNYRFPDNVIRANNGISTPREYTNRALQNAIFKGSFVASGGSLLILPLLIGGFILYKNYK